MILLILNLQYPTMYDEFGIVCNINFNVLHSKKRLFGKPEN